MLAVPLEIRLDVGGEHDLESGYPVGPGVVRRPFDVESHGQFLLPPGMTIVGVEMRRPCPACADSAAIRFSSTIRS